MPDWREVEPRGTPPFPADYSQAQTWTGSIVTPLPSWGPVRVFSQLPPPSVVQAGNKVMRMRNRVWGRILRGGRRKRVCELARRRKGARADPKRPRTFRKHTFPLGSILVRLLSACAGHQLPSSAPARPSFLTLFPTPSRGRPVKPRELWERAGKAVGEGGASGYSLHGCEKERRQRRRRPRLKRRCARRVKAR